MGSRINVQPGDRFGRLTIVREADAERVPSRSFRRMLCSCDCGETLTVRLGNLRDGNTQSCGCLKREVAATYVLTHGQTGTPLYYCWANMIQRSTPGSIVQRKNPTYVGVGRDPRWDRFEEFAADMGPTYFEGACLGRYGDRGNYEPGNVRWQTRSESSIEMNQTRKTNNPGDTL